MPRSTATLKLADLLSETSVIVPMTATDKASAIGELVDAMAASGGVQNAGELRDRVLEREAVRSTGIGSGLAIPHGKSQSVSRLMMAVGKPASPIDFNSIDNRPVWLIVLLGTPPEQNGLHIQALARVSRLMMIEKNKAALQAAGDAETLRRAIIEADRA